MDSFPDSIWGMREICFQASDIETRLFGPDYTLTAAGRRRLRKETEGWNRLASAITSALSTTPEEV